MTTLVIGSPDSTLARAREYGHQSVSVQDALELLSERQARREEDLRGGLLLLPFSRVTVLVTPDDLDTARVLMGYKAQRVGINVVVAVDTAEQVPEKVWALASVFVLPDAPAQRQAIVQAAPERLRERLAQAQGRAVDLVYVPGSRTV